MAEILILEWLKLWTSKWARRPAQDMRPVGDRQKMLIELIKYGSKIFTEADVNNKIKTKHKRNIHVAALDNIFIAMKGLRIFDRFGFNLPIDQVRQCATSLVQDWINGFLNLSHGIGLITKTNL